VDLPHNDAREQCHEKRDEREKYPRTLKRFYGTLSIAGRNPHGHVTARGVTKAKIAQG
jgi:hypothetical protein